MKRIKGVDTNFIITGSKYDTTPQYYNWDKDKKYPNYEEIETKIFNPEGITSLEEGEKWLLTNYPEYYFGASIHEKYKIEPPQEEKEPLDFLIIAVPSYYEAIYHTTDRTQIIKEITKEVDAAINREKNLELEIEQELD